MQGSRGVVQPQPGFRMTQQPCLWCAELFSPRSNGGSRQKFCTAQCRNRFHLGARLWGLEQVERGLVLVSALKRATDTVYAGAEAL